MKFKNLKESTTEDLRIPEFMDEHSKLLIEIKETYDETKTGEMYTFGELLTKCDLTVLRSWFARMLLKAFNDELVNNHMDAYEYVLNKYKNENRITTVNEDNMLLYVISCVGDLIDDEYPYEVTGIKLTNKEDFETFSLWCRPWNEWLNFYVLKENLEDFSIEEFIAAAIYEMTFAGYENAD